MGWRPGFIPDNPPGVKRQRGAEAERAQLSFLAVGTRGPARPRTGGPPVPTSDATISRLTSDTST
jgi:hypothetical protein